MRKFDIHFADGSIQTLVERVEPAPQPAPPLWWVPHDRARYNYDDRFGGGWRFNPAINGPARAVTRINNKSYPEVYRFNPEHSTRLSSEWQDLLAAINPDLTREKALSLLGTGLAFCNTQFAVFDQPRLMGGAVVTGTPGFSLVQGLVDGMRLAANIARRRHTFMSARTSLREILDAEPNILNIKSLRTSQPVPPAKDVLNDPTLWFWCVGVQPDGDINLWWRKGKDGQDYNCRMYLVTSQPIYSRLDELYPLPQGFIPHPQWMPERR